MLCSVSHTAEPTGCVLPIVNPCIVQHQHTWERRQLRLWWSFSIQISTHWKREMIRPLSVLLQQETWDSWRGRGRAFAPPHTNFHLTSSCPRRTTCSLIIGLLILPRDSPLTWAKNLMNLMHLSEQRLSSISNPSALSQVSVPDPPLSLLLLSETKGRNVSLIKKRRVLSDPWRRHGWFLLYCIPPNVSIKRAVNTEGIFIARSAKLQYALSSFTFYSCWGYTT